MDNSTEQYRCFIAIDIPGTVKSNLMDIQKKLKSWPAKVKWVAEQNFHLTLKFLGDVSVRKIPDMVKLLEMIGQSHKRWEISLSGIGAFPHSRNPRVVWVGIDDPRGNLLRLRDNIEAECMKVGFARETKGFSPHLTLGRVKETAATPGFGEIMNLVPGFNYRVPVREFKLMRSVLTSAGPEYSCINSFFLQEH